MVLTKLEELRETIRATAKDALEGKDEAEKEGDKHMAAWYDGKVDGLCTALTEIEVLRREWIKEGI